MSDPIYPTIWNDQPNIVTHAKPLLCFNHESRMIEVRRNGADFFVSTGNLFGSQTITTTDFDTIFQVIALAVKAKKEATLPKLAFIVESTPSTTP